MPLPITQIIDSRLPKALLMWAIGVISGMLMGNLV
jgi:hypothetical protein